MLSLLSSPFIQFHFEFIAEKNRNNQTFIPCCKTRSPPPKTSKVGHVSKQEGQSWFCFTIWRQRNKTQSDVWRIYNISNMFVQKNYFWQTSFFWGAAKWYLCLPSPESFLLSLTADKIRPEMHRQRSAKATMTFKPAVDGQNWTWRYQ